MAVLSAGTGSTVTREGVERGLRHIEQGLSLGCLLNGVAHEVNNQLTNLMLGADHARSGGGAEALDLVVEQAQRIAELCRRIQRLGSLHLGAAATSVDAGELALDFAELRALMRPGLAPLPFEVEGRVAILGPPTILLELLLLITDTRSDPAHPQRLSIRREAVPRSAWAKPGDTVEMAVLRVRHGDPAPVEMLEWKQIVEHFWETEQSEPRAALTMAIYELVRKLRGRLRAFGTPRTGPAEAIITLPLADQA